MGALSADCSGSSMAGQLLSRAGAFALVPVCLWACLIAWRVGEADLYRYQVKRDLARWQVAGEAQWRQWQRAARYNQRSLARDRANAVYLIHGARIQEWRLRVADRPVERPQWHLERAIALIREAIQGQPSWPESWAYLALLKARAGQLDAEFTVAARRSLQLGPWQPEVHAMLVDIGLMAWSSLSDALRVDVVLAFRRRAAVGDDLHRWLDYLRGQAEFVTLCEAADRASRFSQRDAGSSMEMAAVVRGGCDAALTLSRRARRSSPDDS